MADAPEAEVQASEKAFALAAFASVHWLIRGMIALGHVTPEQVKQITDWAATDVETAAGKTGIEAAALIRTMQALIDVADRGQADASPSPRQSN